MTYQNITEAVRQQIRSGSIKFVSARVEYNPETGSKRPYELIKQTACGKSFRSQSYKLEASAQEMADRCNEYFASR